MTRPSNVFSSSRPAIEGLLNRLGRIKLLKASAILGLTLLVACGRAPQPLVDNLIEGMNERDAMSAMGAAQSAFRVVVETSLPKGDPRPPHSVKVVNADRMRCLGQLSDISLSFYLEQLHTVVCYPKNIEAMIDALIKADMINTRGRDFSVVRAGIAIDSHQIDGRWCVSFVSQRLAAKERRWNLRYS